MTSNQRSSNQKPFLGSDHIHPEALKITERLQREGFQTYLVGGCVRDLLSGIQPKDFDIGTMAHPRQIKRSISDAYIIGKRFRLVLVKRGTELFEVATFRRDATPEDIVEGDEKASGENIFGSPQEDAMRRDFTLNGLFYDPIKNDLIDYCDGLKDIKSHTVRMIGDPERRLQEDPIRIMRALRFSHRLDFKIESQLRESMQRNAHYLKNAVLPRRREEILKILRLDDPSLALMEAHDLHILEHIFPSLEKVYQSKERLAEFNMYLRKIHEFVIDPENPAELFGYLLLAYYRSVIEPDPYKKVVAQDVYKDDAFRQFTTMELGMYNVEQALFAKSLEFQSRIRKYSGSDSGFMNDSVPLAIMLAKADYLLSSEKLYNWESALQKFTPRPAAFTPRNKRKRRRRR